MTSSLERSNEATGVDKINVFGVRKARPQKPAAHKSNQVVLAPKSNQGVLAPNQVVLGTKSNQDVLALIQ